VDTKRLTVVHPVSAFTIRHDSDKRRITIEYNELIVDMNEVISERFATIFDANLGAICSFVKEQLENYCKGINTSR